MKQIKVKLTGLRPLIMHNGLMADPTNPYTVAIKKITAKGSKKMTIHDHQELEAEVSRLSGLAVLWLVSCGACLHPMGCRLAPRGRHGPW